MVIFFFFYYLLKKKILLERSDTMGNKVEEFIQFINELMDEEFKECIDFFPAKFYFTNGGCLEFAKILNHYLVGSQFVISKDFGHFAVLFNDNIYDANGIVKDRENYSVISLDNLKNIEYFYGRDVKINGKTVDNSMIDEIDVCSSSKYVKELIKKVNEK